MFQKTGMMKSARGAVKAITLASLVNIIQPEA